MGFRDKMIAFVAPMGAFIALLMLDACMPSLGRAFWLQHPEYWVFPLQTFICAGLLWRFWAAYDLKRPTSLWIGIGIGVFVLVLWIAPQTFLGFEPLRNGFNP